MAEIKSQIKGPSLNCWKRDRKNTQQVLSNEDLILQNVKNLILSNTKERIYDIAFGTDILKLLFSSVSIGVENGIKQRIKQAIEKNEPRVTIIDLKIEVTEGEIAASFTVILVYQINIEGDFNTYELQIPLNPKEIYRKNSMFI